MPFIARLEAALMAWLSAFPWETGGDRMLRLL